MTDRTSGDAASTGLVIPAQPTPAGLAAFRRRHIHHPGAAVPFHVTLAAPFLPLAGLDDDARARLRRVAAAIAPFDFAAGSICCFPTTSVLWLAPSPVAPFESCAEAVYQAFPSVRPAVGQPTFHLTVGLGRTPDDLAEMLAAFRAAFADRLPFRLRARHLDVYAEADGGYRRVERFALGRA
jgi:2'-5' RNA ligase